MEGMIITIEGSGDRVGKHTQATLLANHIMEKYSDIPVKTLSFPMYGTPQAKPVEMYLSGELNLNPIEASALFAIDRSVTYRELKLEEFLKTGGIAIFDRYTESNIIYQVARDLNKRMEYVLNIRSYNLIHKLLKLENDYLGVPKSDKVIYLNLDPEFNKVLMKKDLGNDGGDIHEKDELLLDTVWYVGNTLAASNYWDMIQCNDDTRMFSIEEIHEKIVNVVDPMIKERCDIVD